MVNNKNKKIIFEAVAIIIVILLLATNVYAVPDQHYLVNENEKKPQYNYLIFGMGFIHEILINNKTTKFGILIGEMNVKNYPGWNAPENYSFCIFDKASNVLYSKDILPKEFTLQYFKGLGFINYIHIGHVIDATRYFLIGKAKELI
ncbi:MAG: hypothetical protein AYK22_01225 [Thermoplasmatales archaeon SG8-52-3]|jgi:hypothetical protein|nr:MAG: hypothetical protein AYK22_01225 [Thermoplasmatales archaeon SG8-52-3]